MSITGLQQGLVLILVKCMEENRHSVNGTYYYCFSLPSHGRNLVLFILFALPWAVVYSTT